MSIQVVCPNGHPLTVDDSCAGRLGLCPVCKAPVKVPQADNRALSEDSVLDFLGPHRAEGAAAKPAVLGGPAGRPSEAGVPAKRRCGRCNREIMASVAVCPYCRSYVPGIADASG